MILLDYEEVDPFLTNKIMSYVKVGGFENTFEGWVNISRLLIFTLNMKKLKNHFRSIGKSKVITKEIVDEEHTLINLNH